MSKITNIEILDLYKMNWESIMSGTLKGTAMSSKVGKFRIAHCLRVRDIVRELSIIEPGVQQDKAEIMAIIHDMYKYSDDDTHGTAAAYMLKKIYVEPYLKRMAEWSIKTKYALEKEHWMKIYTALELHSDKGMKRNTVAVKSNPYLRVLMDADTLDHISIEYIEDCYNLFYDVTEESTKTGHLPLIEKYLDKIDNYQAKSDFYNAVLDKMLRKLKRYAENESYLNSDSAMYYQRNILPKFPKSIREEGEGL